MANKKGASIDNKSFITCPSPAKLNLFLHIISRRPDGYHNIQTIFQLIDLCDTLRFRLRDDNKITCTYIGATIQPQTDLCIRAAKLLQPYAKKNISGIDIEVTKRIPIGAGLGGGSSDAATTLIALNKIWRCEITEQELMGLGRSVGADTPVFIKGQSCWAEGIGDQLFPLVLEEAWYVIVFPNVQVNTVDLYQHPELTRHHTPLTIGNPKFEDTENVFEPLVCRQFPAVDRALHWLKNDAQARLTGTGSAVFAQFATRERAQKIAQQCPKQFQVYVAKGLNESPLRHSVFEFEKM